MLRLCIFDVLACSSELVTLAIARVVVLNSVPVLVTETIKDNVMDSCLALD
jgi:hypothetical protein